MSSILRLAARTGLMVFILAGAAPTSQACIWGDTCRVHTVSWPWLGGKTVIAVNKCCQAIFVDATTQQEAEAMVDFINESREGEECSCNSATVTAVA